MNYKKRAEKARTEKKRKLATGKPQVRKTMGQTTQALAQVVGVLQIAQEATARILIQKGIMTVEDFHNTVKDVHQWLSGQSDGPANQAPAAEPVSTGLEVCQTIEETHPNTEDEIELAEEANEQEA